MSDRVAVPAERAVPRDWQRSMAAALHYVALISCIVLALVGKATIARVLPLAEPLGSLEVRALALVGAIVAILGHQVLEPRLSPVALGRAAAFAAPFLLLMGLALGGETIWAGEVSARTVGDLGYFAALLAIGALVVRSPSDLAFLAVAAEVAALALAGASLGEIGPHSEIYEYGQVATTITSYRIYGVGLCAALYLATGATTMLGRILHAPLAIAFTFLCLASTSKTGLVAVAVVLLLVLVACVLARRWEHLVLTLVCVLAGIAAFSLTPYADIMQARIEAVSPVAATSTPDGSPQIERSPLTNSLCNSEQLSFASPDVTVRADSCGRTALVPDGTQRVRLALHAIDLFVASPLWGAGPAGFRLLLAEGQRAPFIYTYPHNVYLEVASSYGVVGLTIIGASLLLGLVVATQALRHSFRTIHLIAIAVLYAAGSLTGGDLYDARIVWLIFAVLGGAYGFGGLRGSPSGVPSALSR